MPGGRGIPGGFWDGEQQVSLRVFPSSISFPDEPGVRGDALGRKWPRSASSREIRRPGDALKMGFDPVPVDSGSRFLLGMRVDATSYEDASARITRWATEGDARYVFAANVHMTMESYNSEGFRSAVNEADLVTPDGMPLAWALRALGIAGQRRVYGPSLMLASAKRPRQKVSRLVSTGVTEKSCDG